MIELASDTELANDRTFLAWLRTGIALFGLGFVVAKVALIVQPDETRLQNKDLYSAVGVVIVLCGAALVVVGYLQHAHVLRSRGPLRSNSVRVCGRRASSTKMAPQQG